MKKISFRLSLFILLFGCSKAQSITIDKNSFHVTLFSNGYTYPESENWNSNTISKQGLKYWSDSKVFTRTFFYPQQPGEIMVALKIKSPNGKSNLKVQLDSTGKSYDVSVNQTSGYVTIHAEFNFKNFQKYLSFIIRFQNITHQHYYRSWIEGRSIKISILSLW